MSGIHQVAAEGILDSAATVSILPFEVGESLGLTWDDQRARIPLAGNLQRTKAMPVEVMAGIEGLPQVQLTFAWVRTQDVPLLLGHYDFFMQFEICFDRAGETFEIKQK